MMDSSGDLFGTTSLGSQTLCDLAEVNGCGVVFELLKSSNGYTETVLYSFGSNSSISDGASPFAGLIMDAAGNLYGTTTYGGSPNCLVDLGVDGCGTVFELVKSSNGYSEKILYTFTGPDGAYPYAGLTMDSTGNLYGTTYNGGACGFGTVFELAQSTAGYAETVLHSFGCTSTDGWYPYAGLIIDAADNLYGTTESAGDSGCGTVFELANSNGNYTENVLYSFKGGTDGQMPVGGLIFDSSGDLYGTTEEGGLYGYGTVFELVNSLSSYSEKVLYSFRGLSNNDGQAPAVTLLMDSLGNLYGTASRGGAGCLPQGCGAVFELTESSGTYVEELLHNFGAPGDGENPTGALVMDNSGNLYGTTAVGGDLQLGTVFEVNPNAAAPTATLSASNIVFSNQAVNTSSSPQSITVTNTGKASLIFGPAAVTISGTNAPEFAITADTCSSATIPVNASCSASVIFTPVFQGPGNAALTFADNAPNAFQTVALAGTGVVPGTPWVTLSPSSLTFSSQIVGTTSAAQVATLTNSGSGPLNITSISASADFSETNNCGSTVAAGANCVVHVSIAPTMAGPVVGTFSISDNAYGSPQSVALSGMGEDFTIGVASGSSSSAAVSPGGRASYALNLTPLDGYNQVVTIVCSGAPSLSVCSASPGAATIDGTNSVPVTISVTTTAPTATVLYAPSSPMAALLISLLVLPATFSLSALRRKRLALFGILVVGIGLCVSCGGGGSSAQSSSPGTPVGTYTLTVTASSGTLTHSSYLMFTVK